jgi:hypothetical protein
MPSAVTCRGAATTKIRANKNLPTTHSARMAVSFLMRFPAYSAGVFYKRFTDKREIKDEG